MDRKNPESLCPGKERTMMLFAAGLLGLAGIVREKIKQTIITKKSRDTFPCFFYARQAP